jgi:hypothetical protein
MSRVHKSATAGRVLSSRVAEETFPYTAYKLRGITYVPHYLYNMYVGPGFHLANHTRRVRHDEVRAAGGLFAEELIAKGADPVREMLWYRSMLSS